MKVVITVGGTGGHVFPAIALAEQLKRDHGAELLFVGGALETNRYFDRESFPYKSVACGSFVSKNPITLARSLGRVFKGMWQSRSIIKTFNPDFVVGFGSYYTFPTLLAAKMTSVPFVLHEANSIPGKVNRLLARYAAAVGVHFPVTATLLRRDAVEVGMPLRSGYRKDAVSREHSREYYHLDHNTTTLLIFGGSQGARAINLLCAQTLTGSLAGVPLQVIHITGDAALTEELTHKYESKGIKASVKTFEKRMDLAWRAADLMIARAGAGTISEAMEYEVPGILIPYPHAADNHQETNADFLTDTVGGAVKCLESGLSKGGLGDTIRELLQPEKRKQMKDAIADYKRRARKQDLCSLVTNFTRRK